MKEYDLRKHILPTDESYGFEMEDYWMWCGSAIKGEDGKYHMFSARWPKSLPFFTGYIVASEIVHGTADTPEGPYEFKEVVLGDRGEEYWDGRMTHNPTVMKIGDKYALFYIGATYDGKRPTAEELTSPTKPPCVDKAYSTIRIGVATADSLDGPWERRDKPIFDIDPEGWDNTVVTNPAPCLCPDGSILMYYRSNPPEGLRLGVARAKSLDDEFVRVQKDYLFKNLNDVCVEDQFVWYHGDHYEMIAKDINGVTSGDKGSGVHFVSKDGITWEYAEDRISYTRDVKFTDGSVKHLYHLERPNITFMDGKPAFLSCAYGKDGGEEQAHGGSFGVMSMSKTLVIPLDTESI